MTDEQFAARTPAEAKRHWMIDRLWSICWFCFVALSFLIAVAAFGAWPEALAGQRLSMLGWLSGGLLAERGNAARVGGARPIRRC